MEREFVKRKIVLKEHLDEELSSQISNEPKLHECSFAWSDKCAHCEISFDEFKKTFLACANLTEANNDELKVKLEECLAKFEGLFWLWFIVESMIFD